MTNKSNIAAGWYTLRIIRSSAGYVFFSLVFMPFLHADSNCPAMILHLQRLV